MSRNIKLRYTYKRKNDGKIWQQIVPIECLEGHGDFIEIDLSIWDLIGRDEYTRLKDKNSKEDYESDICRFYLIGCGWLRGIISWNNNGYWEFAQVRYKDLDPISYPMNYCNIHEHENIGNMYENLGLLNEE